MEKTALDTLIGFFHTREIPGTPEQLELLSVRIGELSEINGREWVRRHRDRLLRQWEAAIGGKS